MPSMAAPPSTGHWPVTKRVVWPLCADAAWQAFRSGRFGLVPVDPFQRSCPSVLIPARPAASSPFKRTWGCSFSDVPSPVPRQVSQSSSRTACPCVPWRIKRTRPGGVAASASGCHLRGGFAVRTARGGLRPPSVFFFRLKTRAGQFAPVRARSRLKARASRYRCG